MKLSLRPYTHSGVKSPVRWPLFLLSLPAMVAIWSGWVGIGEMTGFGPVKLLPGISDFTVNTAVTLPVGLETYAAYSMYAWLTAARLTDGTRRFAKWSAFGSLALGMLGQISYHLLALNKVAANSAPVIVTIGVSAIPVLVVGFGIGLAHAMHRDHITQHEDVPEPVPATVPDIVIPTIPKISVAPKAPAAKPGYPTAHPKWDEAVAAVHAAMDSGSKITGERIAEHIDMKNKRVALAAINYVKEIRGANGQASVATP